jgi:hypothetical protein
MSGYNGYNNLYEDTMGNGLADSLLSNSNTTKFSSDLGQLFGNKNSFGLTTLKDMPMDIGKKTSLQTSETPKTGGLFGFDNEQISGIADIGNLAVSAFAAYDGYKTNKLNNEAIKLKIAAFKEDRAKNDVNTAGFGNVSKTITRNS